MSDTAYDILKRFLNRGLSGETFESIERSAKEYIDAYDSGRLPDRPAIGTVVRHSEHGKGHIFSYDQCDDESCGVDFGRNGQWCMAIRDLEILPKPKSRK